MANVKDLRYVRTEMAIRDAFMELVAAGPVSAVTASSLCRQAGISRNAFYLHHASVADLYAALVDELLDDVRAVSVDSATGQGEMGVDDSLSARLVEILARHEDLLRALLPSDDGSLAKRLADGIEKAFVDAALLFGEHGGSMEQRIRCAFVAWGLVGLTQRWVSLTNRSLIEAREDFVRLHAGIIQDSARFLIRG